MDADKITYEIGMDDRKRGRKAPSNGMDGPRSFRRDGARAWEDLGLSHGDQRGDRGGWKRGVARRTGRSRASARAQAVGSGGSIGGDSAARPQSSTRGGGDGADVGCGAELPEHERPEQGFGGGA